MKNIKYIAYKAWEFDYEPVVDIDGNIIYLQPETDADKIAMLNKECRLWTEFEASPGFGIPDEDSDEIFQHIWLENRIGRVNVNGYIETKHPYAEIDRGQLQTDLKYVDWTEETSYTKIRRIDAQQNYFDNLVESSGLGIMELLSEISDGVHAGYHTLTFEACEAQQNGYYYDGYEAGALKIERAIGALKSLYRLLEKENKND